MAPKISFRKFKPSIVKTIFKSQQKFSKKCKICGLEFTNSERTKKHMIKAHSKPKREKQF